MLKRLTIIPLFIIETPLYFYCCLKFVITGDFKTNIKLFNFLIKWLDWVVDEK